MRLKLLKTEQDYELALKRLEHIFDAEPDTPEGDEAEVLSILIEKYEDEHYPIESPEPLEAIKFRMEQLGINKSRLGEIIGHKSRVSDIFNKKRKLNLDMIRKLHHHLNIPYDSLMNEY